MNSSPLAAIWHWYPLLAWVACARFCSLPLGSLSYLNFYLKLRLDSNFSYGTGLKWGIHSRLLFKCFPYLRRVGIREDDIPVNIVPNTVSICVNPLQRLLPCLSRIGRQW